MAFPNIANRLTLWLGCVFIQITTVHSADPSDPVTGRSHWAFKPLMEKSAGHSNWSQSAVDDFLMEKLHTTGLQPAPEANRRDILRRVCFQLIGLPPSPEQVAAFVGNTQPDALERVVDQLLASPQFGERWGRHWLDLARYADSNGLDENFLFREAWRYRNAVIAAVNANTPFDRFVLEQIAGDLLPFESIKQRDRQRITAGFMVIGPKVLLGNPDKKQRLEVADEQLDTIGRTFLGLTVGCARCHDHKFEPVPTADYYAMAGIFTSTQVMESRYMLGQQRVMERLVGLGPEGEKLDNDYETYWRDRPKLKERVDRSKSVLEFLKKNDTAGLQALVKKHADALADEAKDTALPVAKRIEYQNALVDKLDTAFTHPPPIPPRAMVPVDRESPSNESIRVGGQLDRMGNKVPRGFLQVITRDNADRIPTKHSGREELGRWLCDPAKGAGSLTARVMANRIWHHLMGRGLVRTTDNFGRTGETPSHPELLDFLAHRLIESGWSVKTVVREIVLSRAFAMACVDSAKAMEIDPENRLLWRANRRRLDPEALRDAMLSVSGGLDFTPMDSSVWYLGDQATAVGKNENRRRTDFPCRSLYLPVIRNDLPELFEVFDFANPHATTGARTKTIAATQGLFLLNDELVMQAADAMAGKLLSLKGIDDRKRIDWMFAKMLNGPPSDGERDEILRFIADTEKRLETNGDKEATSKAWSMACHAMFSSSRFQFLE